MLKKIGDYSSYLGKSKMRMAVGVYAPTSTLFWYLSTANLLTFNNAMLQCFWMWYARYFERKTKLGRESDIEGIQQMIIERQGNEKLILTVATQFILAVMTRGNINLGLLKMEMNDQL